MLDSPWTASLPCLVSSNRSFLFDHQCEESASYYCFDGTDGLISSLNKLDLSNPFNFVATHSPTSSLCSLTSQYNHTVGNDQQQDASFSNKYFEPLPFVEPQKQPNYPQLSQKHSIIKQSKMPRFLSWRPFSVAVHY